MNVNSLQLLGILVALSLSTIQCKSEKKEPSLMDDKAGKKEYPVLSEGGLQAHEDSFWTLIPKGGALEILAEGHEWTEGPLWVTEDSLLLYTDIPRNAIYQWKDGLGASVYLRPSGFLGDDFKGGEPGANGLLLDSKGRLVLCQHGERQVARMKSPLSSPKAAFETMADSYEGKRFNSPNDAVLNSKGELYFTDPPYGLPLLVNDPEKELPYQGIYRLGTDGIVTLLSSALSRPNGIAFSRDESVLYVANSDSDKALWMAYDVDGDGLLQNGRIFYDATPKVSGNKGLPDGLKVHSSGAIFATGPGGVFVFSPLGKMLGQIRTGQATSNCAFDEDESHLFITADSYLLRLSLKN